jgi:hypothetical protein
LVHARGWAGVESTNRGRGLAEEASADNRRVTPTITTQRQEILRLLQRLSELTPDVRFGQLIANLSYLAVAPTNEAIWDMEDEQLVEAIRKHIADLSERVVNVA